MLDTATLRPGVFLPALAASSRGDALSLRYHTLKCAEHMHDDEGDLHLSIARALELLSLCATGGDGSRERPLGPVQCADDASKVLALTRKLAVERAVVVPGPLVLCNTVHVKSQRKSDVYFELFDSKPRIATFSFDVGDNDYAQLACDALARVHGVAQPQSKVKECVAMLRNDGVPLDHAARTVAWSAFGTPSTTDIVARARALVVGKPLPSPVATSLVLGDAIVKRCE